MALIAEAIKILLKNYNELSSSNEEPEIFEGYYHYCFFLVLLTLLIRNVNGSISKP